jgi:hypothetical protein
MKRALFFGLALWVMGATAPNAQPVQLQSLTGNETAVLTNPSGSSQPASVQLLRGTTATRTAASGNFIGVAGDTYFVYTAGSLTVTGTLPNPAPDGDTFFVCNGSGTAETSVGVTAPTTPQNQTLATAVTGVALAANTCLRFNFVLSTLTWYRTQ